MDCARCELPYRRVSHYLSLVEFEISQLQNWKTEDMNRNLTEKVQENGNNFLWANPQLNQALGSHGT